MKHILGSLLCILAVFPQAASAGLRVTALGKSYEPDPNRVAIRQSEVNAGGNTSVRNVDANHLDWKEQGYFQRNRDLGQVFTVDRDFRLDAIVLRTGPGSAAVLAGAPGAEVFVQFFLVTGEPRINENGTPSGTKAKHGFSTNHRCDDFLEGVQYQSLRIVHGGTFPQIPPTRDLDGKPLERSGGKLQFMRWELTGSDRPQFEAGKRYAFMVGFAEPGRERGFTLANASAAGVDARPGLTDRHDKYHAGWGLRREGDGTLPPTLLPGVNPPADEQDKARLIRESLFDNYERRFALPPTTDGYPDVDTYRDLNFYFEVSWTPLAP